MYTKYRSIKGCDIRQEVPTRVSYKFLVGVALSKGGEAFAAHYQKHWDLKHKDNDKRNKFKCPVFMKSKSS